MSTYAGKFGLESICNPPTDISEARKLFQRKSFVVQLVGVIDGVVDRLQELKQMGYPIPDEIAGKFPGFVRIYGFAYIHALFISRIWEQIWSLFFLMHCLSHLHGSSCTP